MSTTPQTETPTVMSLEETIQKLTTQRERAKDGITRTLACIAKYKAEGDSLGENVGEMALLDWRDMLARNESAIHHLEAGRRSDTVLHAAGNMDWQQVVLNGGPPCFAIVDGDASFCGRAQRWEGHDCHHKFVSLKDLLSNPEQKGEQV